MNWREKPLSIILVIAMAALLSRSLPAAPRADGQLRLEIVDAETDQPLPTRIHLKNSRGRPVKLGVADIAEFGGHFYIDSEYAVPLRRGQYTFELDASPEYRTQSGHFEIERHADDSKRIEMNRFANLSDEGWWGGDVDVNRRADHMPLILRAEGLQDIQMPEFGLLLTDSSEATEQPANRNSQSKIKIARTPYAWNLPAWLASDELTAIELINHHSLRDDVIDNEDDGRPRDRSLYPSGTGNGRWSETVYYHVLNCGLRIPPAAGSGSGTNDNPVGTNRVYVYCGDEFSPERWWEGLEAGRVFVTNGPLLRPMVEGQPPGYVFHLDAGGTLTLEIGLDLATRVPVEYLQIIKNGAVDSEVRLADWVKRKGRLPPVEFDESGWFLVRAVTNNHRTYQFASSGPYYIEKRGQPRISRRSVQFFLDWIAAARSHFESAPKLSDAERDSLLANQDAAEQFFRDLLADANAE